MKIKLFNRELVFDGYDSSGVTTHRQETDEELENRVNKFIADKKVTDIKYQEFTCGTYDDMGVHLSIMVMYEEAN